MLLPNSQRTIHHPPTRSIPRLSAPFPPICLQLHPRSIFPFEIPFQTAEELFLPVHLPQLRLYDNMHIPCIPINPLCIYIHEHLHCWTCCEHIGNTFLALHFALHFSQPSSRIFIDLTVHLMSGCHDKRFTERMKLTEPVEGKPSSSSCTTTSTEP